MLSCLASWPCSHHCRGALTVCLNSIRKHFLQVVSMVNELEHTGQSTTTVEKNTFSTANELMVRSLVEVPWDHLWGRWREWAVEPANYLIKQTALAAVLQRCSFFYPKHYFIPFTIRQLADQGICFLGVEIICNQMFIVFKSE